MIGTPIDRLDAFEREVRRLRIAVGVLVALIVPVAVLALAAGGIMPTAIAQGPSLRVHELVIVDDRGVERARLGGRLPDAVVNGQRLKRGGNAAGLLIYDDTGRERGGYITFDEPSGNALLTLDTRGGQVAYLAADKQEGIALRDRVTDWSLREIRSGSVLRSMPGQGLEQSRIAACSTKRIPIRRSGIFATSTGCVSDQATTQFPRKVVDTTSTTISPPSTSALANSMPYPLLGFSPSAATITRSRRKSTLGSGGGSDSPAKTRAHTEASVAGSPITMRTGLTRPE
jgi:hypothetical protein